jgi:hypothetical protein
MRVVTELVLKSSQSRLVNSEDVHLDWAVIVGFVAVHLCAYLFWVFVDHFLPN